MSSRNSQTNKAAARERMRAEREQHEKRARIRRQFVVGGSIIAVLAIAAGVGLGVSKLNKDSKSDSASSAVWEKAAKKKLVKPANTTGTDGTSIVIGDAKTKRTLEVFEDARCPACAFFEQQNGKQLMKDVEDGRYKASYTIGTFIDDNMGGTGSKNALSALGAAINVSSEAFLDYKEALYSTANHPKETDDTLAKDATLLKIAQQVPALKDNKAFQKSVKSGTFDKWALTMSAKFQKAKDVPGTPTLKVDGKRITAEGSDNAPSSKEQFNAAIDKAFGKADK